MDGPKILLVEDDANFQEVLCSYLEMHGYVLTTAPDGEKGAEAFRNGLFDLCILDVMMPKKDGFALAREIREQNADVPIIFLTAKTMKEDVLQGFKMGADDYIAKPFNSEELLFRIQAVLKRAVKSPSTPSGALPETKEFPIGRYRFHYPLRRLSLDGREEQLSPKEAALLRMLCQYTNEILPRSEALKRIWLEDNYFTARSMDVFVTKLRKYLRDDPNVEIVNIHGNGFMLKVAHGN
jgi:two-component system OmpR family response regulator